MDDSAVSAARRHRSLTPAVWALFAVFVTLLVRTAWVSDDAYITFRVADNLLSGCGLRWNVVDRVQAYTHPLWLALVTTCVALTGEPYYTSLLVSIVLSGAAVLVALRAARSSAQAVLLAWSLILSKAFVDYSTSGLENPLLNLLIAVFLAELFREAPRTRMLAVAAGLAVLTRMDAVLLLLPGLLAASWRARGWRCWSVLAATFAPLALWMLFSLFYYGFALPNTAYAKLNTGVPRPELMQQGIYYLFNSLSVDAVTLTVILLSLGAAALTRPSGWVAVTAGVLLHLGYVVSIGGDFMSGRFLAAPLLAATVLLARLPMRLGGGGLLALCGVLGSVGLTVPDPNLTTTANYYQMRSERRALQDAKGITDERAIYYRYTGLLIARRGHPMPEHHRAVQGWNLRVRGPAWVEAGQIGILGYYAGPHVHIIEGNGLTDAFIARLPAHPGWRIGHFSRMLPLGFIGATKNERPERLQDEALREYLGKVFLVTRGDLLDRRRLAAIWDLNFGAAGRLIDPYFRLHSREVRVTLGDVSAPKAPGTPWDEGTVKFSNWGLRIDLGAKAHAAALEISFDGNDQLKLEVLQDGVLIEEVAVDASNARKEPSGGLAVATISLGPATSATGFDTVRLVPEEGDLRYSLGHLRLIDAPGTHQPSTEP